MRAVLTAGARPRPANAAAWMFAVLAVVCRLAASLECAERGVDIEHRLLKPWAAPALGQAWGQRCVEYRKVCFDQVRRQPPTAATAAAAGAACCPTNHHRLAPGRTL